MKKYKAIFFDWDGTAVLSRQAPVDQVVEPMRQLLEQGVKLAVISGTTIENIGAGRFHQHFTTGQLRHLCYGLGRGAYNYRFGSQGEPELFCDRTPEPEVLLQIHKVCYLIHERLLQDYGYRTDIVFSRPNYCKIDIMVDSSRGDQLFFQDSELERVKQSMDAHGISGGLPFLIRLAEQIGREQGLELTATTDAKYLEVGITSKSDNVDCISDYFRTEYGIEAVDCCFWGDEYIGMDEGLFGSDSYMLTDKTRAGDFFDVSAAAGIRPPEVTVLHGGVPRFISFLNQQISG